MVRLPLTQRLLLAWWMTAKHWHPGTLIQEFWNITCPLFTNTSICSCSRLLLSFKVTKNSFKKVANLHRAAWVRCWCWRRGPLTWCDWADHHGFFTACHESEAKHRVPSHLHLPGRWWHKLVPFQADLLQGAALGHVTARKRRKIKQRKHVIIFPMPLPPLSLSLMLRIVHIWIFIWILHSICKTFVVRTNGDTFHIKLGRKRDNKTSEHFLILSISLICKVRAQDEKFRTSWAKEDSQKFIFKNKNCPVLCDYYLIILHWFNPDLLRLFDF